MEYIKNNVLDIENLSKEDLKELIRYIYLQFPLDHDKMKELYDDVKVPISFDDTEKDDDDYRSKLTFISNDNPDYAYIYQFDPDLSQSYFGDCYFIKKLHKYLIKKSPRKLKLGNLDQLSVHNVHPRGINDDARGVRYMDWRLYFWRKYGIEKINGITLHDLIIAVYKVRSHKFENNYELYTGIENFSFDDDTLYLSLNFDHGS